MIGLRIGKHSSAFVWMDGCRRRIDTNAGALLPTQLMCPCRRGPGCVRETALFVLRSRLDPGAHRPMRRFFTLLRADASSVSGSNRQTTDAAERQAVVGSDRVSGSKPVSTCSTILRSSRARPSARAATVRSPSSSAFCSCRRFSVLPRIASARRTSGLELLDALLHLDVFGDPRLEAGDLFGLGGDAARQLRFALPVRSHLQAQQHVHDRDGDQRDRHDEQQPPEDLDDRLRLDGVDGDLVRGSTAVSGFLVQCADALANAGAGLGAAPQTAMLVGRAGRGEPPIARTARTRRRRADPLRDRDRLLGDRAQQAAGLAHVEADEDRRRRARPFPRAASAGRSSSTGTGMPGNSAATPAR